jgi:hypothetical protein
MKRIIAVIAASVCVVGSTAAASAEEQQHAICTVADLRGTYSFQRTGTTPQGPLAAVGIATFDGSGFFSVTQTTNRNGVITQGGFDGTYEVNADCSGRWLSLDGQTVTAYFVLVDDGDEMFFLSSAAGNTISGVSKRTRRGHGH